MDRLRELSPGLLELDGRTGSITLVLQGVAERLATAAALAEQDVVELQQPGARGLAEDVVEIARRHLELVGELAISR